jgi:hypothetical protein
MENQFAIETIILKFFFVLLFIQNVSAQENDYQSSNRVVKSKNIEVLIYPNPTKDFLNIESDNIIDYIKITNNLGKTIFKEQPQNNQIDLSNLMSGFYLLQVSINGRIIKKGIIKKKE